MSENMIFFSEEYCEYLNQKTIIIKDTKNKYPKVEFTSKSKANIVARKYRIEDGVLNSAGGKQCDWFLFCLNNISGYLIELKGSDLDEACKQMTETIDRLKVINQTFLKYRLNGLIVLNRINSHQIGSLHEKRLRPKLKQYQGELKRESKVLKIIIT